jgi:hypothetical protein
LLVTASACALEVVRGAWARNVLKPPNNYVIAVVGECSHVCFWLVDLCMVLQREATLATAVQRWCDVTASPSVCCRMDNAVLQSYDCRDRHVTMTTCALLCPWDCNLITCVLPSQWSGSSAAKGTHHILLNQNVHRRPHNSPLPFLSHSNAVHSLSYRSSCVLVLYSTARQV